MSKKIVGLLGLVLILSPGLVLAQDITITTGPPPAYTEQQAMAILPTIINYVFGFLIALVALMIIISGYMFVTAGGSPEKVTTARKWLMFALIGLAIAVVVRGLIALLGTLLGTTLSL